MIRFILSSLGLARKKSPDELLKEQLKATKLAEARDEESKRKAKAEAKAEDRKRKRLEDLNNRRYGIPTHDDCDFSPEFITRDMQQAGSRKKDTSYETSSTPTSGWSGSSSSYRSSNSSSDCSSDSSSSSCDSSSSSSSSYD